MIDTMAAFSVKSLASKPIDSECVLALYKSAPAYHRQQLVSLIQQLALSHERLRQELLGAEQLICEAIEGRDQLKRQGFPV